MGTVFENAPVVKKRLLVAKAIITGITLSVFSYGLAHFAERLGLDWLEDEAQAVIIGLLGGFIFYRLFLQSAVIWEVNYHVRNALQVMLYPENEGDVREALKHIDWTLRKVIRGKFGKPDAEGESAFEETAPIRKKTAE